MLAIAGIATVGGVAPVRSPNVFGAASLADGGGVSSEKRELIERFFALEAAPDAASARLRGLARDAGIDVGFALDSFDTRSSFIAARGLSLDEMLFSTSFPHSIDYYSGFMFDARVPGSENASPTISGGRYDTLLRTLGATRDIPAVGAAVSIERLGEAA